MKWIVILLAILLSGCGLTPQGQAIRQGVATYGAELMDEGLVKAEWFICNAASVGSIQRRYGKTRTLADAWKVLCLGDADADIITVPIPPVE